MRIAGLVLAGALAASFATPGHADPLGLNVTSLRPVPSVGQLDHSNPWGRHQMPDRRNAVRQPMPGQPSQWDGRLARIGSQTATLVRGVLIAHGEARTLSGEAPTRPMCGEASPFPITATVTGAHSTIHIPNGAAQPAGGVTRSWLGDTRGDCYRQLPRPS